MTGALRRRVGLGLLTAYGVGVMVGAGIYVLVGSVIAEAGFWAPVAFLLAGIVALPSALAYAELAARMPEAAGEAAFVEAGFNRRWLALAVGLAIAASGIISGAAVLRGGVGYLASVVPLAEPVLILGLGAALVLVAIVGVLESLAVAALFTAVEVLGLIAVAAAGFVAEPVPGWSALPPPEWSGIAGAVSLSFFAFIGFEDLENLSEEVRDPTRVLPRAILLSLAITALLYAVVTLAAVRSVPRAVIGATERPLALVWEAGSGLDAGALSLVAVAAAVNGVLAQIVMAARVLFGLGRRARWLAPLQQVSPRFGTPVAATLIVGTGVIGGALALPVAALAEVTTLILLVVFVMVNVALIRIKRRAPEAPFRVAGWVPYAGLVLALAAFAAAIGDHA